MRSQFLQPSLSQMGSPYGDHIRENRTNSTLTSVLLEEGPQHKVLQQSKKMLNHVNVDYLCLPHRRPQQLQRDVGVTVVLQKKREP